MEGLCRTRHKLWKTFLAVPETTAKLLFRREIHELIEEVVAVSELRISVENSDVPRGTSGDF